VEAHLGVAGEEILYIGDHVYADVHVTKDVLRWRTALVVRELEQEIADAEAFRPDQARLIALMREKAQLELCHAQQRLSLQRLEAGYGEPPQTDTGRIKTQLAALRSELADLDEKIAVLAKRASELGNRRWGPLLRAGNDKSRLARQLERYADVYTSRVANLSYCTPFGYLRAPGGMLPNDVE
jgi:5'-nucleotidase